MGHYPSQHSRPHSATQHHTGHSVVSHVIREESGRLEDVQLRLRHATLQTTDEVYAHLVPR